MALDLAWLISERSLDSVIKLVDAKLKKQNLRKHRQTILFGQSSMKGVITRNHLN